MVKSMLLYTHNKECFNKALVDADDSNDEFETDVDTLITEDYLDWIEELSERDFTYNHPDWD